MTNFNRVSKAMRIHGVSEKYLHHKQLKIFFILTNKAIDGIFQFNMSFNVYFILMLIIVMIFHLL